MMKTRIQQRQHQIQFVIFEVATFLLDQTTSHGGQQSGNWVYSNVDMHTSSTRSAVCQVTLTFFPKNAEWLNFDFRSCNLFLSFGTQLLLKGVSSQEVGSRAR